jgi:hypothetical protein
MPKAKSKETTGFDALSQDNKEWMKSYEEKGWRFRFDADGWSASKDGHVDADGDEIFGSYDSFVMMMNTVEKAENDLSSDGTEKIDHDARGQAYLPGAEPIVVKELVDLAKDRNEAVREHKRLTARLVELNSDILNAASKHAKHFQIDPDTGSKVYAAAGIEIEITHTETEKVKTRVEEDEDE